MCGIFSPINEYFVTDYTHDGKCFVNEQVMASMLLYVLAIYSLEDALLAQKGLTF